MSAKLKWFLNFNIIEIFRLVCQCQKWRITFSPNIIKTIYYQLVICFFFVILIVNCRWYCLSLTAIPFQNHYFHQTLFLPMYIIGMCTSFYTFLLSFDFLLHRFYTFSMNTYYTIVDNTTQINIFYWLHCNSRFLF